MGVGGRHSEARGAAAARSLSPCRCEPGRGTQFAASQLIQSVQATHSTTLALAATGCDRTAPSRCAAPARPLQPSKHLAAFSTA